MQTQKADQGVPGSTLKLTRLIYSSRKNWISELVYSIENGSWMKIM